MDQYQVDQVMLVVLMDSSKLLRKSPEVIEDAPGFSSIVDPFPNMAQTDNPFHKRTHLDYPAR